MKSEEIIGSSEESMPGYKSTFLALGASVAIAVGGFFGLEKLYSVPMVPAMVTCRAYNGPAIEEEVKMGGRWGGGCEDMENYLLKVDIICTGETKEGTATAYLDSHKSFKGWCNPPAWGTDRLAQPIEDLKTKIPLVEEGYRPCPPTAAGIGLAHSDGFLLKYEFEAMGGRGK